MTSRFDIMPVEQVVIPATRDLGGFNVRRALPSAQRRTVGPFVFLDRAGPLVFRQGDGIDTRPHPHIGLATLTYLLEGEIVHRDSAGYVQTIRPGEVNVMTAGRGIVHSERSGPEVRAAGGTMSGFQTWLALPLNLEETDPGFQHIAASDLPVDEGDGIALRLLAGTLHGRRAPTGVFSDTLYADLALNDGARFQIDAGHVERAVYVAEGKVEVVGQTGVFDKDQLVLLKPGAAVVLRAVGCARMILLGGEPLEGKRYVYWNFVSSRRERIEQAAHDWRERRFPGVPGDAEFTPLPDTPIWHAG
ncbi:MAG: pirin family protein [Bradyrhizobium sp.]|nr:pirin family protein [Bradyrhizobium sp.]